MCSSEDHAMVNLSIPNGGVSKDDQAVLLARAHKAVDPSITHVFRIISRADESLPSEPIKLLEVTPSTAASGIIPVGLTAHPSSGIYFKSIVVEIHPSELIKLQSGGLTLPKDWELKDKIDL